MSRRPARAGGCGGWWPWLGLALLPLAVPPAAAPGGCPSPCYCVATPQLVQCRYEKLEELPKELPLAVHNLSITGSNLSVLPRAAFAARPLPQLRLLRLRHDNIQVVEELALRGLPALQTLDLSHNPLLAVAAGAFAEAPLLRTLQLNQALLAGPVEEQLALALGNLSLRRLELGGNALRALPAALLPAGLEELDLRNNSLQRLVPPELQSLGGPGLRGLRLTLGANPLSCDCALRPFLAWLRAAPARVPDARSLHCSDPPPLRGFTLLRLRPEVLVCSAAGEPGRLETASYVFFGIVLALIAIVFLMVLYLNRRGIKRWLHNLREACRDQMEGYHYRYEQDADPRCTSTISTPGL
ncbi:LOW QUALITY PROTEIN: trophoblast glycoprotein-like [Apus apus]|uniref:LOW QUALITY PROTEIN: trophoblast glycoprotein-like n=1 Tax=Apus apus TaxID=8895 RepID=UPI0021F88B51|nr:LOW QUALITY PROTEIN: trophoblast glycoprotein-like [Apus apus]